MLRIYLCWCDVSDWLKLTGLYIKGNIQVFNMGKGDETLEKLYVWYGGDSDVFE